jgi:hypothetical protein
MQLQLNQTQMRRIIEVLKQVPLTTDDINLINYLESISNPVAISLDEIPF